MNSSVRKTNYERNVQMIVTDLDGTLLKNDKSISRHTETVLEQLRSRGIKFVVATAHPIRAVKKFLKAAP